YAGQTHAISIPVPSATHFSASVLESAIETFHAEHRRRFRHADHLSKTEVVNLRVFGHKFLTKPEIGHRHDGRAMHESTTTEYRSIYFNGGSRSTAVHQRQALSANSLVHGPAIIEQMDSTTVVPPRMS